MVVVVAHGTARNESFGFGRGRGFAIRLDACRARCVGSLDTALDFRYDAFGREVFEAALRKQFAGVFIVQSALDEFGTEYQKQNASGAVCKGFYAKMKSGKPRGNLRDGRACFLFCEVCGAIGEQIGGFHACEGRGGVAHELCFKVAHRHAHRSRIGVQRWLK